MKANPEIVVNINTSLRDYFTAKAMLGVVSVHNSDGAWTGCGDKTSNRIMSETAYTVADAMLSAREAEK